MGNGTDFADIYDALMFILFMAILLVIIAVNQSRYLRIIQRHTRSLSQRESLYRGLVESANDFVFQTDTNGRFTFCNQGSLNVVGRAAEDLVGTSFYSLVVHDSRQDAINFYTKHYKLKQKHTYYEVPITKPDGEIVWIGQKCDGDS